jgi:hypothetical protein
LQSQVLASIEDSIVHINRTSCPNRFSRIASLVYPGMRQILTHVAPLVFLGPENPATHVVVCVACRYHGRTSTWVLAYSRHASCGTGREQDRQLQLAAVRRGRWLGL